MSNEAPTDALRLVPVEPTPEIMDACEQVAGLYYKGLHAKDLWAHILGAAPASPLPGGGWQDISTAPKDGTPILITRPTRFMSEEGYHVVRWDDEQWCCHDGKFDTWLRGSDPTHWMPLPAAPTGDPK